MRHFQISDIWSFAIFYSKNVMFVVKTLLSPDFFQDFVYSAATVFNHSSYTLYIPPLGNKPSYHLFFNSFSAHICWTWPSNQNGILILRLILTLTPLLFYSLLSLKSKLSLIHISTYFYRLSTDKNPSHELCPSGPKSWCKYNVNKCNPDSEPYKHTKSIPPAIMSAIKPIYRDLSKEDLLSKCTHGKTQNLNESFNHVLWSVLPKNIFIRMNTFSFGVYEAISSFNKCYQMKC